MRVGNTSAPLAQYTLNVLALAYLSPFKNIYKDVLYFILIHLIEAKYNVFCRRRQLNLLDIFTANWAKMW